MRAHLLLTASVLAVATPVSAQDAASLPPVERALRSAAGMLGDLTVPAASAFVAGDREIALGDTARGPIAVVGTLRIAGTVDGDAFAYGGDVVIMPGAMVTGSVVALNGRVRMDGGDVLGEIRSLGGELAGTVAPTVAADTTQNLFLTLGWAGVALLVGIGVLVFGGRTLDVVGVTADEHFGRSFFVGVLATLAMAPVLALGVIALALTILGVLLIPFAVVAYVLAVIGLFALGFLAAVSVTGASLTRRRAQTERGAALRSLVAGLLLFIGVWVLAALATPWPLAASVGRVIAFAMTWAAATVGLGATILSRAGTKPYGRTPMAAPRGAEPANEAYAIGASPAPDWLTPTPVSGVAAARRPSRSVKEAS